MFHQARVRLTFLYSFIFLVLFWSLSVGIYFWMNKYFGDTGIDQYIYIPNEKSVGGTPDEHHEPPSDTILDELRNAIVIIDGLLLIIVPLITWFLTEKTLEPVQKSYEREKRFLADASHDLRTPLTILYGDLELALQKDTTKEEYKKIIQSNKEEVTDLISLVENMLFLSREEVLDDTSHKEQVDLTDLLAERVATFQKVAKQKGVSLTLVLSEQSISILGNTQLLKRLITNLLDNAIKYTPKYGKIAVTLNQKNDSVTVKIKDSGIGISQENQERIFERFFRNDTSRSQKGYGLGLSIAKQITNFHKGTIELTSKLGKGTTVTITMPSLKQTPGKNRS